MTERAATARGILGVVSDLLAVLAAPITTRPVARREATVWSTHALGRQARRLRERITL